MPVGVLRQIVEAIARAGERDPPRWDGVGQRAGEPAELEPAVVAQQALVAPAGNGLAPLASEVFGRYLPNRVVAGTTTGDPDTARGLPLLEGRGAVEGKATAYVCRNYACELPVTDPDALARQLDAT